MEGGVNLGEERVGRGGGVRRVGFSVYIFICSTYLSLKPMGDTKLQPSFKVYLQKSGKYTENKAAIIIPQAKHKNLTGGRGPGTFNSIATEPLMSAESPDWPQSYLNHSLGMWSDFYGTLKMMLHSKESSSNYLLLSKYYLGSLSSVLPTCFSVKQKVSYTLEQMVMSLYVDSGKRTQVLWKNMLLMVIKICEWALEEYLSSVRLSEILTVSP
ncbi:hypothetical protein STEG23_038257 [Scotinomys teguina]